MDEFSASVEELIHFADMLRLREKELEQQHVLELEKQKAEFEIQLQIEKRRTEQLQEINRSLTEKIERFSQKQVELEQRNTVLQTKFNCCQEESKQIKDLHNEKKLRLEELEKIVRILTNEKLKLDNEIKQLQTENQTLIGKINAAPPPAPPASETQPDHEEVLKLVQAAVAENTALSKSLADRDNEIVRLKEQITQIQNEDPKIVEQRLLQLISKLKTDFATMYENQTNFFLQKIDLLKQAQRDNIANLYKH